MTVSLLTFTAPTFYLCRTHTVHLDNDIHFTEIDWNGPVNIGSTNVQPILSKDNLHKSKTDWCKKLNCEVRLQWSLHTMLCGAMWHSPDAVPIPTSGSGSSQNLLMWHVQNHCHLDVISNKHCHCRPTFVTATIRSNLDVGNNPLPNLLSWSQWQSDRTQKSEVGVNLRNRTSGAARSIAET